MVKIALAHTDATHSPASVQQAAAGDPRPEPTAEGPVVVALLPAARTAAALLDEQGRRVSRHALAEALRTQGYPVSKARASALLRILKAERGNVLPMRREPSAEAGGAMPIGRD
jgi:hypothetical protein